jgi:hypothetical protein
MGLKNAPEAAASIQRNHSLLQRGSEDFAAWVVIQVFIATYLLPKCNPILDVIKKNLKKGIAAWSGRTATHLNNKLVLNFN